MTKHFECGRCFTTFDRSDYLQKHLERKKKCEMVYKCNECQILYSNKQNLNRHYKTEGHKQVVALIEENKQEDKQADEGIVRDYKDTEYTEYTEYTNEITGQPEEIFIKTHYTEEKYKNIYINNKRTNNIILLENGEWVDKEKNFIIEVVKKLTSNETRNKKLERSLIKIMYDNKILFTKTINKKEKEERVNDILLENGIVFKRNFVVKNKNFKAYIDFIIDTDEFIIVLEVDEYGHCRYDEDYENFRINKIKKLINKPSVVIRYNPDNEESKDREVNLITFLKNILDSKIFEENIIFL
jgi:hypothetical protein